MKECKNTFRYIFRYLIDPRFEADERISELVKFCKTAKVEEVMLFLLGEELSTGHPLDEELDEWLSLGLKVKSALAEIDVAISLNPWSTTYHAPRGRKLRKGQSFKTMVSAGGFQSLISACPLCENFQQWLCRTYSTMVETIEPVAIWIEDDWRLHNHGIEMGWGGCCCELHLQRFSKMVGQKVSRGELISNILAAGQPHPWRKIWMDLWRQTMLEPAERLSDTLRKAFPNIRIGLMSSDPEVHSAEGRDWHGLQDAFGTEPAFLTRPHLPPYTQENALYLPNTIARYTIANFKRPLEIYPELDDGPRNGLFSKSHLYNAWQCSHAAAVGSKGITINHYDMIGNGVSLDVGYDKLLANIKEPLSQIVKLNIDDNNAMGLQVLFRKEVASNVHLEKDALDFDVLHSQCDNFSRLAFLFGISHSFGDKVDPARKYPIAVCGQTLWSLSDDELTALLSGPTLLDAESASIVIDRELGELIGVSDAKWITQQDGAYSFESIIEDSPEIYGLKNPRMTTQLCAKKLLKLETTTGVRSWICDSERNHLFAGLTTFENRLGGKIAVMAYPLRDINWPSFANPFRQKFIQHILLEIALEAEMILCQSHPLQVYYHSITDGRVINIFNPIDDPAVNPQLIVCGKNLSDCKIEYLDEQAQWQRMDIHIEPYKTAHLITLDKAIGYLKNFFIRIF